MGTKKLSVRHVQFLCPFIHYIHKGVASSCNKLGDSIGGIIGRCDHHSLHYFIQREDLARFKKHLAPAHGRCLLGYCYLVIQFNLTTL